MFKGYRTMIFNGLALVPPALDLMLPPVMEALSMPEWQAVLGPELWPKYALAVGCANIVLRSITTTPVGRKE